MMGFFLLCFGNIYYVLNRSRILSNGVRIIKPEPFDALDEEDMTNFDYNDFANSFFYMYKAALGDFDTSKYDGDMDAIFWFIGIVSNILLNITMLNLLVSSYKLFCTM